MRGANPASFPPTARARRAPGDVFCKRPVPVSDLRGNCDRFVIACLPKLTYHTHGPFPGQYDREGVACRRREYRWPCRAGERAAAPCAPHALSIFQPPLLHITEGSGHRSERRSSEADVLRSRGSYAAAYLNGSYTFGHRWLDMVHPGREVPVFCGKRPCGPGVVALRTASEPGQLVRLLSPERDPHPRNTRGPQHHPQKETHLEGAYDATYTP